MGNGGGAGRCIGLRIPGRIVAAAALLAALILAAGVGAQEPDTTPPTITSISVSSDGSVLTIQFSKNFRIPAEDPERNQFLSNIGSRFSVTAKQPPNVGVVLMREFAVDRAALGGQASRSLRLNLEVAITKRQTVTLRYTDPTAADDEHVIEDAAGNELASLTSGVGGVPAVTNRSTRDAVLPPFLDFDISPYHGAWCFGTLRCDESAGPPNVRYAVATGDNVSLDLSPLTKLFCGSSATTCAIQPKAEISTIGDNIGVGGALVDLDIEGAFGLRLHDGGDDDIFSWFLSGTVHAPDPLDALKPAVSVGSYVSFVWKLTFVISGDSDVVMGDGQVRMQLTITHYEGVERAEEGTVVQRFQEWKTGEPVVIRDGARVTGVRSQPGDRAPSGHVFVMVAIYSRKPDGTNGEYLGTGYTEAIPTDLVDQVTPAERSGQNQVVTRLSQLPDTEVWCPSNMIGRMPGARNPTAYYRATAHVTASGTVDFSESAMGVAGCTRTRPGG